MEPKRVLRSFWQLKNVAQIAGLQGLALLLISVSAGFAAMAAGVRGCPPRPEYNSYYLWLLAVVGVGALFLSLFYIFFPRVWMQTISKELALAPTDVNIPFFSTHPLYVFLDALFFIPAIALFESGRIESLCQFNGQRVMGWTILILAFFFPAFRIFSWYVLKRRIEAMLMNKPWRPVIWSYLVALPLIGLLTYFYMDLTVLSRLRVPVVNSETLSSGINYHPEFEGKIVRVQGKLIRGIEKCRPNGKDTETRDFPFATVILDLGASNGQVIVQATSPGQVKTLAVEAENKMGKDFEAFGRLTKLPNPEKSMICGMEKEDFKSPEGIALLEIEMP